jgi:hypothetical protein
MPKFKIQNRPLSLDIGIWDFIGIWCLEFDILQCFTSPSLQQAAARGKKPLPPSGRAQSRSLPRRSLGEAGSFYS